MADDEKIAQMQADIDFLKDQLATLHKNMDDGMERMAAANKASLAASEAAQANAMTLNDHDSRIKAVEKRFS